MFVPPVGTRIKKADNFTAFRADRRYVAALVQIAENTCESKILSVVISAVFSADYMFDLKFIIAVLFGYQTVFADKASPLRNEFP